MCIGKRLSDWPYEPIYAQAYLGCWGIVEALKQGADIVLCGRVADASPTIACAAYHFGYRREDYGQLAAAFVAGHFIECSTYVTGGNFTGFKSLEMSGWDDLGYPIAEIASNGQVIITKSKGSQGEVTTQTCSSQLLYEIQGPQYFGSDVVAVLEGLKMTQVEDRVLVEGVKGKPPPTTTKVGITAKGGWQAEFHYLLCGLDLEQKVSQHVPLVRSFTEFPNQGRVDREHS